MINYNNGTLTFEGDYDGPVGLDHLEAEVAVVLHGFYYVAVQATSKEDADIRFDRIIECAKKTSDELKAENDKKEQLIKDLLGSKEVS